MTSEEPAMRECSRFGNCAVNNCPLHSEYNKKLFSADTDKEQKCPFPKRIRLRIGLKHKLTNKGLSPRELSGLRQSEQYQSQFIGENGGKMSPEASREEVTGVKE